MVGSVIQHRGGHGEKRRKTLHGAEEEAGESIIKHRGGHGGRQSKVLHNTEEGTEGGRGKWYKTQRRIQRNIEQSVVYAQN